MGVYALLPMPRGRRILPKLLYGFLGGLLGGIVGVGWHIMHVDPPGIAIYIVEAGLAVAYWLLKKPKTPSSPNLNPIPIIH